LRFPVPSDFTTHAPELSYSRNWPRPGFGVAAGFEVGVAVGGAVGDAAAVVAAAEELEPVEGVDRLPDPHAAKAIGSTTENAAMKAAPRRTGRMLTTLRPRFLHCLAAATKNFQRLWHRVGFQLPARVG
jgi:hypothetical protein